MENRPLDKKSSGLTHCVCLSLETPYETVSAFPHCINQENGSTRVNQFNQEIWVQCNRN